MEALTLREISAAVGGTYNEDAEVTSICIDTRKITKGCLFICIKGERFDAHNFIDDAFALGAAAVMISEDVSVTKPYVKVDDTSKAMLQLAHYYRMKFDIPLVGLTGSVGKTTTKEFTYLIVSAKYNAIKTLGNMNNEIGLPQMLFQIDRSTEAAVIEMGMNHFGEIHRLSSAANPNVGIITNIGVSHIENLGSREGILKAKLELLDGLKEGSALILNGDNDLLKTVSDSRFKIMFFAIENENAQFKAKNINERDGKTEFDIEYFGKTQKIKLPTVGVHNVYNALAAFAAGYCLDVDPISAALALEKYVPEGMRQKSVNIGGIISIEDCYNASPDSMKAAIATLCDIKAKKKVAVFGDMLELGDYSRRAHEETGKAVAQSGIDFLFAYGKESEYMASSAKENGMKNVFHFNDKNELSRKLVEIMRPGDAVIFKASRGMKLEEVIHYSYDRWGK